MNAFRNIYHLALKEFLHLVRDRRTLAFLILMPSVLTVIFGYAIGSPRVTGIHTRIVDLDGGRIAEEYEEAMSGSITFKPEVVRDATEQDVADAEEALRRDDISAFVVIPKGLSDTVEDGGSGTVRAVVDASDTFTAPSVLRELGTATVQQNAFLAAERARREGRVDSIEDGLKKVSPI